MDSPGGDPGAAPSRASQADPVDEGGSAVRLCADGLTRRLRPALEGLHERMSGLNARQVSLGDRVGEESDKFRRAEERLRLREMVEATGRYRARAEAVRREMDALRDRSSALTQRAVSLMEAKQREAMEREARRQRQREREEELVAKPAPKE